MKFRREKTLMSLQRTRSPYYLADEFSLEATGHHEVVLESHGADLNPRQSPSPLDILHSRSHL
jgi:hypothetical protein